MLLPAAAVPVGSVRKADSVLDDGFLLPGVVLLNAVVLTSAVATIVSVAPFVDPPPATPLAGEVEQSVGDGCTAVFWEGEAQNSDLSAQISLVHLLICGVADRRSTASEESAGEVDGTPGEGTATAAGGFRDSP